MSDASSGPQATNSVPSYGRILTAIAVVGFCLFAGLCLFIGITEHVVQGSRVTYRYAWWLGPFAVATGIYILAAWWLFRTASGKTIGAIGILALPILFLLAPMAFAHRVVIDDERVEMFQGFWFAPSHHDLPFRDLDSIRHAVAQVNRGKREYELRFRTKTGGQVGVSSYGLLGWAVPEILARAKIHGVETFDER